MRKTDKKIDNQLRLALKDVCDIALQELDGFQWLTHRVNYSNFPQSLKVVCVFDSNEQLSAFSSSSANQMLSLLIQAELSNLGISLTNMKNHILYDTEENCESSHNGNWAKRLA